MRKQKIWVDSELLKYDDLSLCCTKNFDNTFYTNNYSLIDNEEYFEAYFQSIKTHNRELVKEVCEKIKREILSKYVLYIEKRERKIVLYLKEFNAILDQIQKEFEK